jgi:acetoin utilization protein AcuB
MSLGRHYAPPKGFSMIVRKHMSAPPITISHDTDFKAAMGLMQQHRIRRLPVVDARGALAGIVAERDLLVAADRYLSSPVDVAQIMTREVVTVGETTPVIEAATLMIERKIGGLPVLDASRKLRGIITETDLLKALAAILKRRADRNVRATARRRALATPKASSPKAPAAKRPPARTAKRQPRTKSR